MHEFSLQIGIKWVKEKMFVHETQMFTKKIM